MPTIDGVYVCPKCPHGRRRVRCRDCGGGSICEHGKHRAVCRECGGSGICEHDRQRAVCRECGGGSICEHGKHRAVCRDCGGGSICEHDRQRSRCRECGGGSICEHGKHRAVCRDCDPNGYIRSVVSVAVRHALKSADLTKSKKSLELVGKTSAQEVWEHLQSCPTFEPWMTLDNLGRCDPKFPDRWNIDHIVPVKYGGKDVSPEELLSRLHFTNLQPLRASANVAKGARRIGV